MTRPPTTCAIPAASSWSSTALKLWTTRGASSKVAKSGYSAHVMKNDVGSGAMDCTNRYTRASGPTRRGAIGDGGWTGNHMMIPATIQSASTTNEPTGLMIVRSDTIGVLTSNNSPLVASTANTGLVRKWVTERRRAVASSHRPTTGGAPYMSSGTAINTMRTWRPIWTDRR